MNTLQELRKQHEATHTKAKGFWASVEASCGTDKRDPTDEERTTFDGLIAQVQSLETKIKGLEADEKRQAALSASDGFMSQPVPRITKPSQPTTDSSVTRLPTSARRHAGRLTVFSGPGAERLTHDFGMWIVASQTANPKAVQYCRDHGLQIGATMSSNVNTAGGALIPDVFVPDLIRNVEERGVFRREARVVPMTSDTQIWPRRTSGQTAYFVAEAANPTESDIGLDNISLVAKEAAVMTVVPRNLMEDSMIDLGELVGVESALAFATLEDTVGFNGAGTAAHGGIHGATVKINDGNHAGSIYSALSGNTAFSTLDLVDFEGLIGALPMFPGHTPKWYISKPGYYASMARLMDAAGGNTKDDVAGGTGLQFLGFPVVISQVLNSTLSADVSAIKLLFGDLRRAATLGDRRAYALASDGGGKYFQAGTIAIKATTRFDVNVHELGDGSNAGPLMAMKTPGS